MNYSLQIYGFYNSLRTVIPQNTQIMAFSGDCCLSINTKDEERTSAWYIPWWRNEWRFPQTIWLWKIHSENGSNSRRITVPFEVSGDKFWCQIITWYKAQQEGYVSTNLRQIAVINAISERHPDEMIPHGSYLNTMAAIFSWLMITDGNSIPYAKERIPVRRVLNLKTPLSGAMIAMIESVRWLPYRILRSRPSGKDQLKDGHLTYCST